MAAFVATVPQDCSFYQAQILSTYEAISRLRSHGAHAAWQLALEQAPAWGLELKGEPHGLPMTLRDGPLKHEAALIAPPPGLSLEEAVYSSSSSSDTDEESVSGKHTAAEDLQEGVTQVVYNIPWEYTQEELLKEFELEGMFDFFHVPFSGFLGRSAGVAIINFTSGESAAKFKARWHKHRLPVHSYRRALTVGLARQQGRHANLLAVHEDAPVLPEVRMSQDALPKKDVAHLIRLAKAGVSVSRL